MRKKVIMSLIIMTSICFSSNLLCYASSTVIEEMEEEIINETGGILLELDNDNLQKATDKIELLINSSYGYLTADVNIREEASISANILDTFDINTEIKYINVNDNNEWVKIVYYEDNNEIIWGYIYKEYISDTRLTDEEVTAYYKAKLYLGSFIITYYCACSICCGISTGITASGTIATAGKTIAVDPDVIPYGTQVVINGVVYTAEDTGSAITGNHIDIFCSSHEEAVNNGTHYADVYLYSN